MLGFGQPLWGTGCVGKIVAQLSLCAPSLASSQNTLTEILNLFLVPF